MGDSNTSLPPVDNVSSSLHLDTLSGSLQGGLDRLTSKGQTILDKIIPPPTRSHLKTTLTRFATARPLLASFLLSQVVVSGLPLALFLIVAVTVVVFALLTGILVGVLGALLFIVLALGVALFVLLPTLFITTFFAVAVWLWVVAAYYIAKWFGETNDTNALPLGDTGSLFKKIGLTGGDEPAQENGVTETKPTEQTHEMPRSRDEKNGIDRRSATNNTERDGNGAANTTATVTKSPSHRRKQRDGDRNNNSSNSNKTPIKSVTDVTSENVTDQTKNLTGLVS